MVLPVLLLGAVGWMLRLKKAAVVRTNEPFRLTVDKIAFVPLTPREVFDGYDTKAVLTLSHSGPAPTWWKAGFGGYSSARRGKIIAVTSGGKRVLGRWPYVSTPHRTQAGEWQAEVMASLASVTAKTGELRFQDSMAVFSNGGLRVSPPMALDFRLRSKGVTTRVPLVDRRSKISLLKVFVAPSPRDENAARVRIWLSHPSETQMFSWSDADLVDGRGNSVSPTPTYLETDDGATSVSNAGVTEVFTGNFDLTSVKTSVAKAEAIFSNGKEWPLRVSIPLRDANNTRLNTPNSGLNCTLANYSARKATAKEKAKHGCDTVITWSVSSLFPARRASILPLSWDFNQGAHVENSSGEQWWPSNLATQITPPTFADNFASESTCSGTPDCSSIEVTTFVNLAPLPPGAGKLWFKDRIRLNDGQEIPISIPIR